MEIILNAITSIFKILLLKFIYGDRCNIHLPASFGKRTEIHIDGKKSSFLIRERCISRGDLHIRVENEGKLTIGRKCFFNHNISITCIENIQIGDECQFANNIVIIDHDHNYKRKSDNEKPLISTPISIGNHVWIGANCVILRGTIIGDHAVIAAGSIVKGIIEPNTVFIQKRNSKKE